MWGKFILQNKVTFTIFIISVCYFQKFQVVTSHGMMLEPINRASIWRKWSEMAADYDDDGSFCGGLNVQVHNRGKCGTCGDNYHHQRPRAHELGGVYGSGKIVANYPKNTTIKVHVELTTNHRGWFKFDICNIDKQWQRINENQRLFKNSDLHPLGEGQNSQNDDLLGRGFFRDGKTPRFKRNVHNDHDAISASRKRAKQEKEWGVAPSFGERTLPRAKYVSNQYVKPNYVVYRERQQMTPHWTGSTGSTGNIRFSAREKSQKKISEKANNTLDSSISTEGSLVRDFGKNESHSQPISATTQKTFLNKQSETKSNLVRRRLPQGVRGRVRFRTTSFRSVTTEFSNIDPEQPTKNMIDRIDNKFVISKDKNDLSSSLITEPMENMENITNSVTEKLSETSPNKPAPTNSPSSPILLDQKTTEKSEKNLQDYKNMKKSSIEQNYLQGDAIRFRKTTIPPTTHSPTTQLKNTNDGNLHTITVVAVAPENDPLETLTNSTISQDIVVVESEKSMNDLMGTTKSDMSATTTFSTPEATTFDLGTDSEPNPTTPPSVTIPIEQSSTSTPSNLPKSVKKSTQKSAHSHINLNNLNEHFVNLQLSNYDDAVFQKTPKDSNSDMDSETESTVSKRMNRQKFLRSLTNFDFGESGTLNHITDDDLEYLNDENNENFDDYNSASLNPLAGINPQQYNYPLDLETEECFESVSLLDDDLYFVDPDTNTFYVDVKLPENLVCQHCVFRWYYRAGNNWGVCSNGVGKEGCGPQETFINCADISIQ